MLSNDRVSCRPGPYRRRHYRDYFRPETKMHWVRLMLVCRHWYKVGQSSPWLWRRISITRNMESLKYRLLRTVGCTIDVFFSDDGDDNDSAMTLLTPFAPHIRTLETCEYFSFDILPSIRPLVQVPLPALECIKLLPTHCMPRDSQDGSSDRPGDWFDLGLSRELHPRVRRLEIRGITIPSHPAFFSALRDLVIGFEYLKNAPLCPQDVVNILAHSPCLEVLEISGTHYVWNYPPDPASTENEVGPRMPTRYRLPYLRRIILKCPYHFATSVLRAVDAQELAVFHVELSTDSPIVVAEIGSLIFPPPLRYLVQQYTEVLVASNGRGFKIYDIKSQPNGSTYDRNRLHLAVIDYTGTLHPLEAALTTLSDAFGIAPKLRSLCFVDFGHTASPTLWNSIPTVFPDLHSVTLRRCSPPVVADFLWQFKELSKKGAWPAVRELDISTGADWMPSSRGVHVVAENLLATVRARTECGVPLASIGLEHDVLMSTPLTPHRWTLWAIHLACEHFDFRIYHGRNHIPRRLGQLFTPEERQRLLDGSWDASGDSDEAAASTVDVDSLENGEGDGRDEHLVSIVWSSVWNARKVLTELRRLPFGQWF